MADAELAYLYDVDAEHFHIWSALPETKIGWRLIERSKAEAEGRNPCPMCYWILPEEEEPPPSPELVAAVKELTAMYTFVAHLAKGEQDAAGK